MIFAWQPMDQESFADIVGLLGPHIVRIGEIHWVKVRTCFYRPMLPMREYRPEAVHAPWPAQLGGVQYAVPEGVESNSFVNYLIFDKVRDYSLAVLDRDRRRQVRLATREFELRSLSDVEAFKREAYPVYLSFYSRTHYQVGSGRRDPSRFAGWAEALFKIQGALIIGAYRQGTLAGVSTSYLTDGTLFYASFFCDDESMKRHLPGLMLHTVLESAAASQNVQQVFVGMFKGQRGLDDFYLQRGARLVRQPARLEINPVTRILLHAFLPKRYAQLLGHLPDDKAGLVSK
ncbi:MAG TPA: hypothetical protein VG734_26790 [Lacunisphaera sp.]|nr:hypothetical protein [Lacunisphaera sp.]